MTMTRRITLAPALLALCLAGCGRPPAPASSPTGVLPPGAAPSSGQLPTGIGPPPGTVETDTDLATARCAALGSVTGEGAVSAAGVLPAGSAGWLAVRDHRLVTADGSPFHGRGANLADPRGCGACACNGTDLAASTAEVIRRIDALADDWHANFIRLDLESYASGATSVVTDPAYLAALEQIVAHVQTRPQVYLVLSVWFDPSLDPNGWPTAATQNILTTLVQRFGKVSQVLLGISNEPQKNADGALDAEVWERMNGAAQAIRDAEAAAGVPQHIILAQGTGGWARTLTYYETHPITAAGGTNIAYEVHVYDHADAFDRLFGAPAQTLPVVIGEFGPLGDGGMTLEDTQALMPAAEAAGVPYMAWTFHGRCVPSLLVDSSGGGCGLAMPLRPSQWGQQLQERLHQPW